jgi:ribosomal protein S18 acetylase RimI-like enzyme
VTIRVLAGSEVELVDRHLPLHRLEQHRRGNTDYLVVWDGEHPVGHAHVVWDGDAPELQDVWVVPERRREGIAWALTAEAERLAAERGHDSLQLTVATDNVAARRLYERAGYVEADRAPKLMNETITIRGEAIAVDVVLVWMVKALGAR